jgi:tryptophanyl-tRNA synthetase
MHLGHYVGALKQWVEIQNKKEYECFFLLADIQALTTHSKSPAMLPESIKAIVLDWLSIGLDPSDPNVHFVLQGQIPERHELSILLSMITPWNDLSGNPTLKDELQKQSNPSAGFMLYPVDQAADIYMVNPFPAESGDELLVPVGEDQSPILELSRRIARVFNKTYGPLFVPCKGLVGEVGRLPGIRGTGKMGKSDNNAIYLTDTPKDVEDKVMGMFTDQNRLHATDPGETRENPVFQYHRAFNQNKEEVAELTERYESGRVGDVEVKKRLVLALNDFLHPIRERRAALEKVDVREILVDGTAVTRATAKPVIERVRELMHIGYP